MACFGAPTRKPTMLLTNNPAAQNLLKHKVKKNKRARKVKSTTTKRYRDKYGRMRFCGTPQLKRSQILVGTLH